MPIAFTALAISLILKAKNNLTHYILLLICAFSVGGSAENVSASVIASLSGIGCYVFVFKKNNLKTLFRDTRIKQLALFLFFTSIFAIITYTAPGARNRALQEANNLLLKSNPIFAPQHFNVFLTKFFHSSTVFSFLFLAWFFYLGMRTGRYLRVLIKQIFVATTLCFIISVLVHLLITKIIFDSYGYLRIWFPVNFFMFLMLAAFFMYIGNVLQQKSLKSAMFIPSFFSILWIGIYANRHIKKIHTFSSSYFQRTSDITSNCNTSSEQLYISKALGDPDILYYDKFVRFPEDSLSTYFCIFNEIPCKNIYIK